MKTLTWMLLFSFSPVLCLSAAAEEWAHIKCQEETYYFYESGESQPSDDVYIYRFSDTIVERYAEVENDWQPQNSEVTREAIKAMIFGKSDRACPDEGRYQLRTEMIVNRSTGRFSRRLDMFENCDMSNVDRISIISGSCEPADNPQAVRKF